VRTTDTPRLASGRFIFYDGFSPAPRSFYGSPGSIVTINPLFGGDSSLTANQKALMMFFKKFTQSNGTSAKMYVFYTLLAMEAVFFA
jgi:hypothetical protein